LVEDLDALVAKRDSADEDDDSDDDSDLDAEIEEKLEEIRSRVADAAGTDMGV
jgi:hypothetical protein